ALGWLIPHVSLAASPGSVLPGSADPGRILEEMQPIPEPRQAPPPVMIAPEAMHQMPKGAEKIAFLLKQVVIEGSTVYSQADLRPIYEAYLGQRIPLSKVYEFGSAITERYREDGYALSWAYLPPQEI